MNKAFHRKKILITGHTGFKGSWLTFWLEKMGAKICGISKDIPTKPSLYKVLNLEKRIQDKRMDIRDLSKLKSVIKKFKPDFIFHLAAQSLVKKSYSDPVNTFTSNAIGTCNILESHLVNTINICIQFWTLSDSF